jgi:hypothetical protein
MISIFISYRRDDSLYMVDRIYDQLSTQFGKESLFKDVDSIALGMDFRHVIQQAIGQCDVLLAIIGEHWLDVTDESGRRRLENEDDFVRIEIETTLRRGIPVIPLLLGRAVMPRARELPPGLRELAFRNGLAVRPDPDFHHDMDRVSRALEVYRKLQVLSLQVSHYRGEQATQVGDLGYSSFTAWCDDDVRVQVRLNRPAYCYLIAFNADGTEQLCSPREKTAAPSLADAINYPTRPWTYFGLTDGTGLQAFVLVAALEPLPPYEQWRSGGGATLWQHSEAGGVWRFDGRQFELLEVQRARERERGGPPPALVTLCDFFLRRPGVAAFEVFAFPVRPKALLAPPALPEREES